jgi:HAD superfamily hydrolase (TIGR01509 family)
MSNTSPYDLVIFDCDGVLVDSEMLSANVLMNLLSEIGINLTFDEFRVDFLGRAFSKATQRLSERTGLTVPKDFQAEYFERLLKLFVTDLRPMAGIGHLLDTITINHCVASSSIPPRLDMALKVCGLEKYFGTYVYSAVLVENAKPAPDLFFHAAEAHGVAPARCLVIEDSEMGILAAQAAGMTVWHFAGGEHMRAGYSLPRNLKVERVVQDMAELHHIFCETGICVNVGVAG